jgi:curved DNA-binding protein CbpA
LLAEIDAYRILQIDPRAETLVLDAAYRALARRYHPDGVAPDITRMAEINRAYALIRTTEERRRYDGERLKPVGPGDAVPSGPIVVPPSRFDSMGRRETPSREAPSDGSSILAFGRYAGWSLRALSRHDADYLRWLMRHSSGVRYRGEISKVLPKEPAPGGRVKAKR